MAQQILEKKDKKPISMAALSDAVHQCTAAAEGRKKAPGAERNGGFDICTVLKQEKPTEFTPETVCEYASISGDTIIVGGVPMYFPHCKYREEHESANGNGHADGEKPSLYQRLKNAFSV